MLRCRPSLHDDILNGDAGNDTIEGGKGKDTVHGNDGNDTLKGDEDADKLFGDDYRFSVLTAGRHQMPIITMAATLGGSVRVGLEDSLYDGRELAKSNADQVRRIRTILDGLSLEVATPDEARIMLGLKGGDRVAF